MFVTKFVGLIGVALISSMETSGRANAKRIPDARYLRE
ncbi:WSSV091 [White spot syndrome virus]|uniref:WSSV091 n=1 Tax=White spot syndrome virus TaxID=342409 RepID=A0A2I6SBM2_9VIRU|nr:WSSV091 [White spot syndrome virus]